MGRIAIVLAFARSTRAGGAAAPEVKVNPGGGPNVTADHFAPAGVDAPPLPGDYAVLMRVPGGGRAGAVGYVDTANAGVAEPGEYRAYARNALGAIVGELWLKGDGTITLFNALGAFTLLPTGIIDANGVTIDPLGNVTTPTTITAASISAGAIAVTGAFTAGSVAAPSVKAGGLELALHTHPYVGLAPTVPGTTGPYT